MSQSHSITVTLAPSACAACAVLSASLLEDFTLAMWRGRQNLATWLEGQPGRQADAAAAWQVAARAGELDAYSQLARVLAWLYGRRAEAAEARRVAFVVADRQGWTV